jgi:hypothetical protein
MLREARLDAPGALHHGLVRRIEKPRIVDDAKDSLGAYKRKAEAVAFAGARRSLW